MPASGRMACILQIFRAFNGQEVPSMRKTAITRAILPTLCLVGLAACSSESTEGTAMTSPAIPDEAAALAADLATAEGMIDAFYTFDPDKLRPFLSQAGESGASIL